ncbi:MAG: class I SAM-dependent methyltransferase [Bacteroidota bacterium]
MRLNIPENTSKNTHNIVDSLLVEEKDIDPVLDIPAGAGAFTQRLLKNNIEVHSADIENILEVENDNFEIANMNATLPYEDAYFTNVVCIDGIEHLENPFTFIRECKRVIKPEGKLIISTPNINSLRSRWRWFWTSHHNKNKSPLNENKPSPLHHINMLSYQKLRYILHTNGFQIEKVKTNRIKLISWIYLPFVPLSWILTKLVFQKEEKDIQQQINNKTIISYLFSSSLLFGETMIVKAKCVK